MNGALISVAHRRNREAGFSLIEVLVSVALLALILTALPQALKLGKRGLDVSKELDLDSEANAALFYVEQRLTQAMPLYRHGDDGRLQIFFIGNHDRVTFVAPSPAGTSGGGLYRFELMSRAHSSGEASLVLGWSPYLGSNNDAGQEAYQERVLLKGSGAFEFRYYGHHKDKEQEVWDGKWSRPDTLPDLVEIRRPKKGEDSESVLLLLVELRLTTTP